MVETIKRIVNPQTVVKTFRCTCKHQYQDTKYGSGMRVHNARMAKGKHMGWRCTVCGNKTTQD